MYEEGLACPIHPVALFSPTDIEQCFRYLQKGDHIGKAVVQIPPDPFDIPSALSTAVLEFDSEACYLLTGGLGGVGRSIATWMVERGARHLIFISRSAGSRQSDQDFFTELRSIGCLVDAITGEVQNQADLARAVTKASRPVKGVLHLAMVLGVRSSFPRPIYNAPTTSSLGRSWT